jgi:hypothetical protein
MSDAVVSLIAIVFAFWLVWVLVRGSFRTFERNFFLALILLLVLAPVFFVWAFIEGISND